MSANAMLQYKLLIEGARSTRNTAAPQFDALKELSFSQNEVMNEIV